MTTLIVPALPKIIVEKGKASVWHVIGLDGICKTPRPEAICSCGRLALEWL